jgi:hypothetical protein
MQTAYPGIRLQEFNIAIGFAVLCVKVFVFCSQNCTVNGTLSVELQILAVVRSFCGLAGSNAFVRNAGISLLATLAYLYLQRWHISTCNAGISLLATLAYLYLQLKRTYADRPSETMDFV